MQRVMLTQPNYAWFGRRSWKYIPYNLGILNACLRRAGHDSWIYDPNFGDDSEEALRRALRETRPEVVGIGTASTEYIREPRRMSQWVKEELPGCTVVLGGVVPTIAIDEVIDDPNVDYFILGEGEYRLPRLLGALRGEGPSLDQIDGLAWGSPRIVQPAAGFIEDLDAIPFPDYTGLDVSRYAEHPVKYSHDTMPRQYPYALTVTSRGCPYRCIFCSGSQVTGKKVRMRSADNVLEEIDRLYQEQGVREVIFLDDHFLMDRARAMAIMNGLLARNYDLTWKCMNLGVWSLDTELLQTMRDSGCYQFTVSIESGNQRVLRDIIKKPLDLAKVPPVLNLAKRLGFEIIANFIIGFPGESWEEIRQTIKYAEDIGVDLVNFHIATPLPRTELWDICVREGFIDPSPGEDAFGFTAGCIETDEFRPLDLQILRAYEWDRINFATAAKRATVARMEGISEEALAQWRLRTRHGLGSTADWNQK